MHKISSKLDWTQMLGFEQISEKRSALRDGTGKLNSKVGGKLGQKTGDKRGVKIGSKLGVKIGNKEGLKN